MYGGQNPTTSPMVWTLAATDAAVRQSAAGLGTFGVTGIRHDGDAVRSSPGHKVRSGGTHRVLCGTSATVRPMARCLPPTPTPAAGTAVRLTVTDNNGATASATTSVSGGARAIRHQWRTVSASGTTQQLRQPSAVQAARPIAMCGILVTVPAVAAYRQPHVCVPWKLRRHIDRHRPALAWTNATTVGWVDARKPPVLTFHRTIAGTIAAWSPRCASGRQAVPFTTSVTRTAATISSPPRARRSCDDPGTRGRAARAARTSLVVP